MIREKLRVFKLLLYKDFLVRKRHWKMGLFVEILIPLLLFFIIWSIRNLVVDRPRAINVNVTYTVDTKPSYSGTHLYVVPDNKFVETFMEEVQKCLQMNSLDLAINRFHTENDMLKAYKVYKKKNVIRYAHQDKAIAVIFKNKSIDFSTTHLEYKIRTPKALPKMIYEGLIPEDDPLEKEFIGMQLCLDESFIKMKTKDPYVLNMNIITQKMPTPAHVEPDEIDNTFRKIFCAFAVLAFLIPLCIETSNASDEKFLGINVLMAMNGVSNYLNLLSWLVSGLIFSLLYIIPIVALLNLNSFTLNNALPFLYYSNSFIFWIILTLHVAHLIAFGMHISAYFTRSLFMVTGILVIYIGSTAIAKYGLKESTFKFVPYLGIIYPNILLFRACEEVNYYESIMKGIHWNNMFRVGDPAFRIGGSIGMILIFSLLGTIFHFIMANYIYAINPGKYGVRRNPFYFLKLLKSSKKLHNRNELEKFECNNTGGKLFETVTDSVFTPGIQIRNLKKIYNAGLLGNEKVYALRGISVDFYQRQITALLGHNGAGKTTMMSILAGMISPSEGLVLINGKHIKDDAEELMNDMGLCPQENIVFPSLSVAEQLTFFAMLKSKNKPKLIVESEVKSFLQKLKLFEKHNSLPKELSVGQKRRMCLGMALVGDSSTIILDEPTSGLDPESRRDIWDILLKMRGEKTVLLSTHNMEEADILGDRIAIIHSGTLKSYGTPMYLKKLLGQGNIEVILSTESWCDPGKIRSYLDSQSEIVSADGGKVQLSIPYNPELPDLLDKIESNKKELGVTGMNVSLITLEQVFLKVVRDNEDSKPHEAFINTIEKLKGRDLFVHSAMGLLRKKMTYTLKNIPVIFVMLSMLVKPMFVIAFLLMDLSSSSDEELNPVSISLDMYDDANTVYRTDNNSKDYGHNYTAVTKEFYGKTIENLNANSSFIEALTELGARDRASYNYRLIAAGMFSYRSEALNAKALYNSPKALFSIPISINLLTNTVLKTVAGGDHSIRILGQQLPHKMYISELESLISSDAYVGYIVASVFVFFFYPMVALLVVHPLSEAATNVKHLQRMAGASCFAYWGTMFVFDFALLMLKTLLLLIAFVAVDAVFALHMFGICEVLIFTFLFALFAINVLPLIYTLSFSNMNTSGVIKLLTLLPLCLVAIELVMTVVTLILDNYYLPWNTIRPLQKGIFLLTPYISFYHGLVKFFKTLRSNGDCIRLAKDLVETNGLERFSNCGAMKCANGTCEEPLKYFDNFKEDIALETSVLSLCLTPILYFGLLCILEHKLMQRLIAVVRGGKPKNVDKTFEEQVKKVKQNIAFEVAKIKNRENDPLCGKYSNENTKSTTNGTDTEDILPKDEAKKYVFFVYELRKLYGSFAALQDISFGVRESECFGLLGVNGAGKSTTFKAVTGEEVPHHGIMYLNNMDMRKNRQCYLSQMGYCPQNDAIIKSLNAYDHLRLFARLRGIPERQVETEVKKWIDILNLRVCASCASDTYSGGNKRRLNIAIAFIGLPNLILLDEPTTGVDPAARRSLWNVIQSCQATGQSVILTSHSMEECEALCNRLAIMIDGKFECIGASQELRQRFGAGYNVQLKLNPGKSKDEMNGIKQNMSEAFDCEIIDENSSNLTYHLKSTNLTWRRMYDVVSDLKKRYASIEDFSVLSATLEQLFLLFAKSANKSEFKM